MIRRPKGYTGAATPERQEQIMRDAVVEYLRQAGIEVSTDWKEGQRILDEYNGNGQVKKMGQKTNKKKAQIAADLEGMELTPEQQAVVDVFTGKSNNSTLSFTRDGKQRRVIMRKGNEVRAGAEHSLFRHYGTTEGVISSEDVLRIPDVLATGERTPVKRGKTQLYEYTLTDANGVKYTVVTENKHGREEFADFYTNKKGDISRTSTPSEEARASDTDNALKETSASKPSITQGENTQSAQSDDANASSDAKVQQNPETAKDSEGKIKEQKAREVSMKPIDADIPNNPTIRESLDMMDRVKDMPIEKVLEAYNRLNSQMLEEGGLNVDEHEMKVKREWMAEHGTEGLGQTMADHLKYLFDKYGYGKLQLRWELLDRLEEAGIDPKNTTSSPGNTTAKLVTMRPKFFKTPDGHAYGYTYKGKVYVDPRIATSETPVHEYGHLWVEMKRQTAPDEWNDIKQVMLTDKLVQPIIERVKRDYPELAKEGREDDFIEEIITQFSGKRGAERLREIANEVAQENGGIFGKAEAVTAMQRLKNILNSFWEGVAKMMGWKYRNANQIADRMMADMLNGVDPTKKAKDSNRLRKQAEMLKQTQLDIILKNNPADDENMPGHTWVRSLEDIKTFKEALEYDGLSVDENVTPDFTADMVRDALKTGEVTVYSSKPIKDGVFVTPSKMEAQNYAGDGKVYSKNVPLSDVAWIDAVQGQYAETSKDPKLQMVGRTGAAEADRTEGNDERTRNLRLAEEAEKAGEDAHAIKFATGWERGADGQWRYEIPDADVDIIDKYNEKYSELSKKGIVRPVPTIDLVDLLGKDNELFKYYPELRSMPVQFSETLGNGTSGSFDGNIIKLNAEETVRFDDKDLNNENIYGTLLHEIQHAIQEIEGFAQGGSLQTSTTEAGINAIIEKKERQRADIKTRLDANNKILSDPENLKMSAELEGKTEKEVKDQLTETVDQQAAEYDTLGLQIERLRHANAPSMTDARDLYHRLAGEVEARNVTERMNMTEEQRRQSLASETEDVPREDQVVIAGDKNGNSMSIEFTIPEGRDLSEKEVKEIHRMMESGAEEERILEHTEENWLSEFGKEGKVNTPIGEIKMGDSQYPKAGRKDRIGRFGLVKPTLERPDVILEKFAPKKGAERNTKYLFIKSFVKTDGSRIINFESVTVRKEGNEVSISTHEIDPGKVEKELRENKMLWNRFSGDSNSLGENQGLALTQTERNPNSADSGLNPHSIDKDTENIGTLQENEQKNAIQGLDGYTEKDVTDLVEQHFKDLTGDDGLEIVGMKVIGSRTKGKAREDSDLDVLLEFKGDMSEDGLFNVLNDEENRLYIEGIPVDINPITQGKGGTIEQWLKRNADYDKENENNSLRFRC